jgi:hypothetical protein
VSERALTIDGGGGATLVGILSAPPSGVPRGLPTVIILNAGLIHRVGPHRLHVRLARRLAAAGIASLRLDLSGRGDSETRGDDLSFAQSGIVEVRAAMDHLEQQTGVRQFVLLGICSGADTSGQVACLDPRVTGVVAIEGATYPTRKAMRRYYLRRLGRLDSWANTLTGRNAIGRRLFGRRAKAEPSSEAAVPLAPARAVGDEPRRAVGAALQMLVDRGVHIMTVFTGSTPVYNYVGQIVEAFPEVRFGDRLRELYYPRANHTFTRMPEQAVLIGDIVAWMGERFDAIAEAGDAAAEWPIAEELTEVVHL